MLTNDQWSTLTKGFATNRSGDPWEWLCISEADYEEEMRVWREEQDAIITAAQPILEEFYRDKHPGSILDYPPYLACLRSFDKPA